MGRTRGNDVESNGKRASLLMANENSRFQVQIRESERSGDAFGSAKRAVRGTRIVHKVVIIVDIVVVEEFGEERGG